MTPLPEELAPTLIYRCGLYVLMGVHGNKTTFRPSHALSGPYNVIYNGSVDGWKAGKPFE